MTTRGKLDAKAMEIRGSLLGRVLRDGCSAEQVEAAMNNPEIRNLVNVLCQLAADKNILIRK